MGDGSAIGGWILTAAIITVLAGGASAASGGFGSSGSSGSSSGGTTSTAASRSSTRSAAAAAAAAPPCTRVSRRASADGRYFKIVPVTANGNVDCRLRQGDSGRTVTVLQDALRMCSNRTFTVDGTYSKDTSAALARDQEQQLAVPPTGIYDPTTARRVRWPWYDRRDNDRFTGFCGKVGDPVAR